jgi:hypothetical protein
MTIGDRVRRSGHSLESLRMYWLSQGEHTRKLRAREAYDVALAERGTITEIVEPTGAFNAATRCRHTPREDDETDWSDDDD